MSAKEALLSDKVIRAEGLCMEEPMPMGAAVLRWVT